MNMDRFINRFGTLMLVLIALIVLISPLILRIASENPITPGSESYLSLRYADLMSAGRFGYDPIRDSFWLPTPHIILLNVMQFFGVPWLLPGIIAGIFAVLLWHLLSGQNRMVRIFAIGITLLSPAFSLLGTHHSSTMLAMLFLLMAVIWKDRPSLGAPSIFLALITTPALGIIGLAYFAFLHRRSWKTLLFYALAALLAATWFFLWTQALPNLEIFFTPRLDLNLFFELGNPQGLSLFLLVISVYGLFSPSIPRSHIWILLLLVAGAAFFGVLLPLASVAIAIYAAIAVHWLMREDWKLDLLKQSLMVLLVCIGIFLLIVSVKERVAEQPDVEMRHMMISLGNQHRAGAVLSDPDYAPVIEYFSGKKATLNRNTPEEYAQNLFTTRDSEMMYDFLEETETSFIFVTDDMELRWFERSDQGLLFLLPNSGRFVTLQQTPHTTLWYFIAR